MKTHCKIIENIDDINSYFSEILKNSFLFDIETTGFSRVHSNIISITIMLYEDNQYKIYQLFAEFTPDEKQMLLYMKDLIKNKNYAISYNGNSFDIPFLLTKSNFHNINLPLENFVKIDLYHDVKKLKSKISMDDLKLKSIEKYFDIKRSDTLSGQDIILLYDAYKVEPKNEFSFLILQHNYEDVYNLFILFEKIYNLYDEILFYNNIMIKINESDFSIKKNCLICNFSVISNLKNNYVHHNINFDLNIDIKSQTIKLIIPLNFFKNERISEFYFVDNNNFNLKKYLTIPGLKNNLIPIKFNNKFCMPNTIDICKILFSKIFS